MWGFGGPLPPRPANLIRVGFGTTDLAFDSWHLHDIHGDFDLSDILYIGGGVLDCSVLVDPDRMSGVPVVARI